MTTDPCNPQKIPVLRKLFGIPAVQRGDSWLQQFHAAIPDASMVNPAPKIFYGPDQFPYFHLQTPREGESVEAFCLINLLEYLTTHGLGAAINPSNGGQQAEWVFSYGDMLSFRMFGAFKLQPDAAERNPGQMQAGEQVLVAAPSQDLLPVYARQVLGRFMKESLGVPKPGVLLLSRANPLSQQLIFSIFPEDFSDPTHFQGALRSLRWFLPRHYVLDAISRESPIAGHFTALES
jgi:hypothetical protein